MIGCLQLTTNENPLVSTVEIDSKWLMSGIVIGYVSEDVSYQHKDKYFFYYAIRGGWNIFVVMKFFAFLRRKWITILYICILLVNVPNFGVAETARSGAVSSYGGK